MRRDIDWNRVGRCLAGEASKEEREEFEKLMAEDPEFADTVVGAQEIWRAAGENVYKWDVDRAWGELSSKARLERSHRTQPLVSPSVAKHQTMNFFSAYKLIWRVAAIVLAFLGVSYLAFHLRESQGESDRKLPMREIVAEKGQRITFKFDEGTEVVLNAGSVLRFPDQFGSDRREVYLEGEALFQASRLNGIPFIVRAGAAAVEVLGTQFSVRAWPGEKNVRVIVAEGKVAFRAEGGRVNKSVILLRGQMSSVSDGGDLSSPSSVDVEEELSWVSGKLLFDKTPLRDALKSLERRYALICMVSDSTILSRRLTATFKDESTDEVLKIISLSLDLRYKRNQDTVIFRDNLRQKYLKLFLPTKQQRG
jgi:ferric-dicitrate binding protein FerR (iron transport regulator)